MKTTINTAFSELKQYLYNYSEEAINIKINCLNNCSKHKLNSVNQIKEYHNQLLFLISYAENEDVLNLAEKEMHRLSISVNQLSKTKQIQLVNSGIVNTETHGTYSLTLINWLLNYKPNSVQIHSFGDDGIHPKELLKHFFNEMEFEAISNDTLSKIKWLQLVSGLKKSTQLLNWLVTEIIKLPLDIGLKEQLFESLKLYIRIKTNDFTFSRSFGSIKIKNNFFHTNGILKKFNEVELIHKKLPLPQKLALNEKNNILNTAKTALLLLNRETDPITYGNPEDVLVYNLEHGLTIALFCINPKLRLPIESYIGFMMFKNGYPMSYGGAWLYGKRSLIGINIFEAFRGGESAFVFAQLLRTYAQAFGATQFEVEPYQFGKGNPEGIKSGAFWFYYRFGFRPINSDLFKIAEQEFNEISKTKNYRTSFETLKQFTKSNLIVNFKTTEHIIKPVIISNYITQLITKKFNGDRIKAMGFCKLVLKKELGLNFSKLNELELIAFNKLAFFLTLCLELKKLTNSQKKQLVKLVFSKSSSEYQYITNFLKFPIQRYFVKELLDFKNG